MLVTVPIILDQAVDYCFHFLSVCWSLFLFFSDQDMVTVSVILDQAVGYCSHYFG